MKKSEREESKGHEFIMLLEKYLFYKEELKTEIEFSRHYGHPSTRIITERLDFVVKNEYKSRNELVDFVNKLMINK